MNGEAKELRELARQIEELVRQSSISSAVREQVHALADYITLRARVIELEGERDGNRG